MKQRQAWFGAQLDLDPRKLVFIDETGASTNLARKGGRCRRGRRLRAGILDGHYKTVTLVAGLRLSGLVAQKAFDKPMNAAIFEEWAKRLVPDSRKVIAPSWTLVHRNAEGRAAHRGGGSRVAQTRLALQPRYMDPRSSPFGFARGARSDALCVEKTVVLLARRRARILRDDFRLPVQLGISMSRSLKYTLKKFLSDRQYRFFRYQVNTAMVIRQFLLPTIRGRLQHLQLQRPVPPRWSAAPIRPTV